MQVSGHDHAGPVMIFLPHVTLLRREGGEDGSAKRYGSLLPVSLGC